MLDFMTFAYYTTHAMGLTPCKYPDQTNRQTSKKEKKNKNKKQNQKPKNPQN